MVQANHGKYWSKLSSHLVNSGPRIVKGQAIRNSPWFHRYQGRADLPPAEGEGFDASFLNTGISISAAGEFTPHWANERQNRLAQPRAGPVHSTGTTRLARHRLRWAAFAAPVA